MSDRSALKLLKLFSRLEFALKQIPAYLNGEPGKRANTQWSAYARALRTTNFAEMVSDENKSVLFGNDHDGPPPKKMKVDKHRHVCFSDELLPQNHHADTLIESAKRTRNNLVHGGKEHKSQERARGHDQRLVNAAIDVMECAIRVDAQVQALCEVR